MKKKLLGLAIFGIILATVGGSGAVIYYQKAEKELKQSVAETYLPKDQKSKQTIELTLSGDVHYSIKPSNDEEIHLNSETYSNVKKPVLTWTPTEKNGKTLISINFDKAVIDDGPISFGIWDNYYDYVEISLPKSYETILIKGSDGNVTVSDITATALAVESTDSWTELENLRLDSLTATSDSGSFNLTGLTIDKESSLTSNGGEIRINDSRTEKLFVKNRDEQVHLDSFIGASDIQTDYGDIYLYNVKGPTKAKTIDADIYWQQEKITDDSELFSTDGDIVVDLIDKIKQIEVSAKSKSGDISLLEKKKTTLKRGENGPKLQIETTYGDITLSDEASYSDEFEYGYDD